MGKNSLRCLHCGHEFALPLPCSINMLTAMSNGFIKDHKSCKKDDNVLAHRFYAINADAWIHTWDTGISSETIWSVMTGHPVKSYDIPYDPSDFGRCHRLLQRFPEWRTRLGEVAAKYVRWRPFVDVWDELTALYEEELQRKNGCAPKLYKRMQELRDHGFPKIQP